VLHGKFHKFTSNTKKKKQQQQQTKTNKQQQEKNKNKKEATDQIKKKRFPSLPLSLTRGGKGKNNLWFIKDGPIQDL